MVKLTVKKFSKVLKTQEDLIKLGFPEAGSPNKDNYKYPFSPIPVIKSFRTYLEEEGIDKLPIGSFSETKIARLINLILVKPQEQDTIIYEGNNIRGALMFYKESKALGYPVVIEGIDIKSAEILYGKT